MIGRWVRLLVRILGWPLARPGSLPNGHVDAIVVLGAPLRPDGRLGEVLAERVTAGIALWERAHRLPLLCMTGGPTRGAAVAEATAMAAAARAAGVPDEALVVEDASQTTYENGRNLAALLVPAGRTHILIVTQPFHLLRARMDFGRFGFVAAGHVITDGVQARAGWRGLRWVLREYPSLLRDFLRR